MQKSPNSPSPWVAVIAIPIAAILFPWTTSHFQQQITKLETAREKELAEIKAATQEEAQKREIEASREAQMQQHFLGMAVGILEKSEVGTAQGRPLRLWAAQLVKEYSPVELHPDLMEGLVSGSATLTYKSLAPRYVPSYSYSSDDEQKKSVP